MLKIKSKNLRVEQLLPSLWLALGPPYPEQLASD